MHWARRQTTGNPHRKAVLLLLADWADESWSCFPGQAKIAEVAEVSERTVRKAIADLEAASLIRRQARYHEGMRTSDRYWLNPSSDQPAAGAGTDPATPVTPADPAPTTGRSRRDTPAAGAGYPSGVTTSGTTSNPTPSAPASPPADPALFEVPTVVDELCTELATAVGKFADAPPPAVTKRWRNDMRLLLERGPLHQQDPAPTSPELVRQCLQVVFTELAEPEGRGGFCWAAQIRSPHALRDHWHQMRVKARQQRERLRGGKMDALARQAGDDPDDLGQVLADVTARREQRTLAALGHTPRPALGAGA